MAFALTKVKAWGVEAEEAVNKRYIQFVELDITGLNSNYDLDLGDVGSSPGTFWNAVDGSEPGDTGLAVMRAVQRKAESFIGLGATSLAGYVKQSPVVTYLDSAASTGGNATETLTVTGLLTTDTILGATIVEDGANPAYIQEAAKTCAVAGQYIVTFSTDPGAGAEVRVVFYRTTGAAVQAGTYQLSMDSTYTQLPNILFVTGNAPTSYKVILQWILKDGEEPVEVTKTA